MPNALRPRSSGAGSGARFSARLSPTTRWRLHNTVFGSSGPRRYLAPGLTLAGFFRALDERGVSYAVLRWFDTLPQVEPGEDVDLLIDDEHLPFVHTLLRSRPLRPGSQAFDVYTVSGLPGTDFGGGLPYYPPQLSRGLLAGAVMLRELYRVPDLDHHFLSLAYHAVYHKGYASGLRADAEVVQVAAADHDYAAVLTHLAQRLGIPLDPTLDRLDRMLADAGLRPPLDTLQRLAPRNRWIQDRFLAGLPAVDPLWHGLTVFVLRERAEENLDLIRSELDRHGFEVLDVRPLSPEERQAAGRRIRGGNWERGPWPLSGGRPSSYLICYDVAPWFRPGTADAEHGSPENQRVPEAKSKIRARLLAGTDPAEQFNPLHSSDNARQALDYLDILDDPAYVARLGELVGALVDQCRMPFAVLQDLVPQGPARRARVALIDHPVHGPSVCKIYRPGAQRYFLRELHARQQLGELQPVPGLLDHGDNWLVTPRYTDDHRQVLRHLPFEDEFDNAVQLRPHAAREMAQFVRALHERGLFLLDLTTENLYSDPRAGLKVLDLEFLQPYDGPVPPLEQCYSVHGIPQRFRHRYDVPQDVPMTEPVGNQVFHPAVAGLPWAALVRSELPLDTVRRELTQWTWYLYVGASRLPSRLSRRMSGSRSGRLLKRIIKKALTMAAARLPNRP